MTASPASPPSNASAGLPPGLLLVGRYEVVAPIASGGMSTVYRGFDRSLGRPVAIKIMSSRLSADPTFARRFEREARSMAGLNHPGLVSVHDHGTDRGHAYLVMELVDGGTLRDVLRAKGQLMLPEAFAFLDAILQPLAHAHAAGLIHRDIKPENVLVSSMGVVKLTDFGLVRSAFTQTLMTGDMILGTVPYMAPEQIAAGTADTRTDVYSVGIVAFEMLTGAPPFSGDNAMSVAYQHVHSDVPTVSSRRPGAPESVDDLIRDATRREPDDRPGDASALHALVLQTGQELDIPLVQIAGPVGPSRRQPLAPLVRRSAGPNGHSRSWSWAADGASAIIHTDMAPAFRACALWRGEAIGHWPQTHDQDWTRRCDCHGVPLGGHRLRHGSAGRRIRRPVDQHDHSRSHPDGVDYDDIDNRATDDGQEDRDSFGGAVNTSDRSLIRRLGVCCLPGFNGGHGRRRMDGRSEPYPRRSSAGIP